MARLAVVTGASSGIGEAYARRLAASGWDLIVVARRRERLEALADQTRAEHGVETRVVEADLGRPEHLAGLCEELADLPVEMLVNNAGLAHYMPFSELSPQGLDELLELNAHAPLRLARAVLPGMISRGSGAIVNVASMLAFSGNWETTHLPARAAYAATKALLVTFSQLLADEVREQGVRVQALCPGVVRSEFHSRQGMDLSGVPRMEPDAVVAASLQDLEGGVVVCLPAAPDATVLDRAQEASRELMRATRAVELPARYRS